MFGDATLGFYYINIYIGDNMHKRSLIVDTGSSVTTFPCSGCINCGTNHYNAPYEYLKSSGFSWVTRNSNDYGWKCEHGSETDCTFTISYYEGGEYTGRFIQDYVVFFDELAKFQMIKEIDVKKS